MQNKKILDENNIHMNQIIVVKQINKSHRRFFKLQFIVSVLMLVVLFFYYFANWKEEREMERVSEIINKAFDLETVYEAQKMSSQKASTESKYFGKISIPKIDVNYSVFNECSDELLKILPCKFYGPGMAEKGNVCIAGHNYEDDRFFSKLDELERGDLIFLSDLGGQNYKYVVYEQYEVKADDFECLKANKGYELTLITCNNTNGKRRVIKASGSF